MILEERIIAFASLGSYFQAIAEKAFTEGTGKSEDVQAFENACHETRIRNPWFIEENIVKAISAWASVLTKENIERWLQPYQAKLSQTKSAKKTGVINAGNIPFVGFHDFLCVIISGNIYIGKNSSDDQLLLPFIAQKIISISPSLKEKIFFEERLKIMDAVIATGSNNSSRYFEYYFGKYPHIIRRNRNAVAVLTGDESKSDLENLGKDIFQYFGLGCRNVSKLFVPTGYDFKNFFEAIESFSKINQHNKYMNNYDYNKAIYLLKQIPFFDNGFVMLKEDKQIASPISVVYYEFYETKKQLVEKLESEKENIQCIIAQSASPLERVGVRPGQSQHPQLWDYADGVDVMKFLIG